MINEAIKKITDEAENKAHLIPLEEHLTNICNEKIAGKILQEDKHLADAFKTIRTHAKSKAQGGVAVLTDEEVYSLLEKYYGITEEDKTAQASAPDELSVSIEDFL